MPTSPTQLDDLARRSRYDAARRRQAPRRAREARVRGRAAELAEDRCAPRQVASGLRLSPRTLRRWRERKRRGELQPRPVGRPAADSSLEAKRQALETIARLGPHVGLPTLRSQLPQIPRAELIELQRGYRRHHQQTYRCGAQRLTWTRPGTVWTMDHKQPPEPIAGRHEAVLAIRDLASGMQLAWLPTPDATADPVATELERLFREHGPPLILKSDNGSAFTSDLVSRLLKEHRVTPLFSPPATPRYNGGCEASIGAMSVRTEHQAHLHGRPGCWREADLAAALHQANHLHRPARRPSQSAENHWSARAPITEQQRRQFLAALAAQRAERTVDPPPRPREAARIERQAITQVLVDLGLLTVTWRSVPLPFKIKKAANVS